MQSKNTVNQHSQFLDVCKGIAIFIVLWSHVIQVLYNGDAYPSDPVFKAIYSFHMPLFMLISGYLFSKTVTRRSAALIVKGKLLQLGWPALLWSLLYTGLSFVSQRLQGNTLPLSDLFSGIFSIWFLWTTLFLSLLVLLAEQFGKVYWKILFIILGGIVCSILPNGDSNLYMYPYFLAAFYFGKYRERISAKLLNLKYAALLIWPLMLVFFKDIYYLFNSGIFLFSSHYFVAGQIWINAYRFLIGLSGAVFAMVIVETILSRCKSENRVIRCLCGFGTHSLHIYVMQQIALMMVGRFACRLLFSKLGYNPFMNNMLLFYGISLIIACAYCFVLRQISSFFSRFPKLSRLVFGR